MGDLHSLPEQRRQKEGSGKIRFLDFDEEKRLFSAILGRSKKCYRLSVFLVDTGVHFGEAIELRWTDVANGAAIFCNKKAGNSRSLPLTKRALGAVSPVDKRSVGPLLRCRTASVLRSVAGSEIRCRPWWR